MFAVCLLVARIRTCPGNMVLTLLEHAKHRVAELRGTCKQGSYWDIAVDIHSCQGILSYAEHLESAGCLARALSMMQPESVSAEVLNKVGFGVLVNLDLNKTYVTIAAVIGGGLVAQEEQRDITNMVDEVNFDLGRRGPGWAKCAVILFVRFPDVESFVGSLAGKQNLVRAAADWFPTRQHDECKFHHVIYMKGRAWEVRGGSQPEGTGASLVL